MAKSHPPLGCRRDVLSGIRTPQPVLTAEGDERDEDPGLCLVEPEDDREHTAAAAMTDQPAGQGA